MKQFSCGDVVPGCRAQFRASTNEEILSQVAEHARREHGMASVPAEVVAEVTKKIREGGASGES